MLGPIQNLGPNVLTSTYLVNNGIQGILSKHQWHLDVEQIADITLAAMQGAAVDAATGPADPEIRQFYSAPVSSEGKYFCRNQVYLPNPWHTTISRHLIHEAENPLDSLRKLLYSGAVTHVLHR